MTFSIEQFRLDGQVAVVTGAGGRGNSIGSAYAKGLAAVGAKVVVVDLNEAGAKAVANEINASGGRAIGVGADITNAGQIKATIDTAVNAFGGIDILVNNAALMLELGNLQAADVELDAWRRLLEVNVTGAMICSQTVIPHMRARGGGRIVNQVSGGAFPPVSLYGVSKLALVGLTTTMAKQLGSENIKVNAIAPGNVTSDAGSALVPPGSPFAQSLAATCCTRGQGEPDELVGALLLLCSPAGDWITGQTLHIDGGWVMRP